MLGRAGEVGHKQRLAAATRGEAVYESAKDLKMPAEKGQFQAY